MKWILTPVFILLFFGTIPTALLAYPKGKLPADGTSNTTRTVSHTEDYTSETSQVQQPTNIRISVTPDSAAGALIIVVRKSKIESDSNSTTIVPITPDTIGTWKAPLSIVLFPGDYSFIVRRPGFRQAEETYRLDENIPDSLSIQMFSVAYLRRMRSQWGTYKWISGGVAAGAGLATLYFYEKIGMNMNAYNRATTTSGIESGKNAVLSSQRLYGISSGIALSALGSFLITWLIQNMYSK